MSEVWDILLPFRRVVRGFKQVSTLILFLTEAGTRE